VKGSFILKRSKINSGVFIFQHVDKLYDIRVVQVSLEICILDLSPETSLASRMHESTTRVTHIQY
jgi:hypothetical protein